MIDALRRVFAVSPGRLVVIDVARGVALVGMFGYHLTWDLADFGMIGQGAPFTPGFRLYSHVVASAFLGLAGVSLVLARRPADDWPAFTVHIARIVAAAALVTLASWFLFPDGLIFFGILHCIAAALIVAVPFLYLPWFASLLAALAIIGVATTVRDPFFDHAALVWTGIGTVEPSSNDFRAFFPWAAPVLIGVGLMMLGVAHGLRPWLAQFGGRDPVSRSLAFGGRHSLAIYLIHQPVFFGLLSVAALGLGPAQSPVERAFADRCEAQCSESGAPATICTRACACTARDMHTLNLWDRMIANALDEAEKKILSRVAQRCVSEARP